MKVKLILPALTEATSPFWRPIKYSLFPPLGLATLAIDTAGAPAFGAPEIPDLFADDAEALARTLLDRFYPARAAKKAAAIQESRQAAERTTLAT